MTSPAPTPPAPTPKSATPQPASPPPSNAQSATPQSATPQPAASQLATRRSSGAGASVTDERDGIPAGLVTRAAAYVCDVLLTTVTLALGVAGAGFLIGLLSAGNIDVSAETTSAVTASLGTVWWVLVIGYTTASFGQSPGMAIFGLRVERRDGRPLRWARAVVRAFLVPILLVLTLGIDALFVLGPKRLALHDRLLGTRVAYGHGRLSRRADG